MCKIDLTELKNIELNILKYVHNVCTENGLRYFLCGGTLLGAIRHKGFIPWDDDIDIAMPRDDYEELLNLLNDNKKYIMLNPNNEGYYNNFAKIIDSDTELTHAGVLPIKNLGVFIDVFPIDGMPDNESEYNSHFLKLHKLRKRINSFAVPKPKIRKNMYLYFKKMWIYFDNKRRDLKTMQNKYVELAKKYEYDSSNMVYMSGGAYGKLEMFPKNWVDDYIDVEFEGYMFKGIKQYDKYLRKLYGEYMELPPEEKQKTHHYFIAKYK